MILANAPAAVHAALIVALRDPPAVVVMSGVRPEQAAALARGYGACGLRRVRGMRTGGFACQVLVAA